MRYRSAVTILFPVLVFSTLTAPVSAKELDQAQIKPIDATPLFLGPDHGPACACQVGNLNSPAWAIVDFIDPPDTYELVFDPKDGCGDCLPGFQINKIHVLLQTEAACDVILAVAVGEVFYPNDPNCPEPSGLVDCATTLQLASIPCAGVWDIGIVLCCGCLTMDRKYVLSLYIDSYDCACGTSPALVTDAGPAALCTNWTYAGGERQDLVVENPEWPGNLLFYANAYCCSKPVPVENKTWGAIKQLYSD